MGIDWEGILGSGDLASAYESLVYDAGKYFGGSYDYEDEEPTHCYGKWNGESVRFSRYWSEYYFTDEECEKLLNGETIYVHGLRKNKTGNTYGVAGKLDKLTYKGHEYVGFSIIENTGVEEYNSWCGHRFTDSEKELLKKGEEVYCADFVNKEGKSFRAFLHYDTEEKRIVPRFVNRQDAVKQKKEFPFAEEMAELPF